MRERPPYLCPSKLSDCSRKSAQNLISRIQQMPLTYNLCSFGRKCLFHTSFKINSMRTIGALSPTLYPFDHLGISSTFGLDSRCNIVDQFVYKFFICHHCLNCSDIGKSRPLGFGDKISIKPRTALALASVVSIASDLIIAPTNPLRSA